MAKAPPPRAWDSVSGRLWLHVCQAVCHYAKWYVPLCTDVTELPLCGHLVGNSIIGIYDYFLPLTRSDA